MLTRLSTSLYTVHGTSLVKQTLGSALSVDTSLVDLLFQRLNGGQIGAAGLALSGTGVSATYFSDPKLTTAILARIDPGIAFGEDTPRQEPSLQGPAVRAGAVSSWSPRTACTAFTSARPAPRSCGSVMVCGRSSTLAQGKRFTSRPVTPLRLRAGQLYELRLEIRQMSPPAIVELRWSADGTPKVPPANLYPASLVEPFVRAFTLLHKVGLIVNGYKLTAREVAYLLDHAADFAGFDLQGLPLDRNAPGPVDQQAVSSSRSGSDCATTRRCVTACRAARAHSSTSLAPLSLPPAWAQVIRALRQRRSTCARMLAATGWDGPRARRAEGRHGFNLAPVRLRMRSGCSGCRRLSG